MYMFTVLLQLAQIINISLSLSLSLYYCNLYLIYLYVCMHVFTILLYVRVLTQVSGDSYNVYSGMGKRFIDIAAMDTCIFNSPFSTGTSCASLGPRD